MREWQRTGKTDPDSIRKIDEYLVEVCRAIGKIGRGELPSAGPGTTISGVTSHHLLSDLTNYDDHPQYLYLAGRSPGQTGYGSDSSDDNLPTSTLTLYAHHGTSSPRAILGPTTVQVRGGSTGSIFMYGRAANSTQPFEVGGGVDYILATLPGSLTIKGGGSLAHTAPSLTIDSASGSGFTNNALANVRGAASQTMAAGVGGMYQSWFQTGGTPTANHMAFWAPGKTPSLNSPDSYIDKNGVWTGAVSGAMTPTSLDVADNVFTIHDDLTTTKVAKFQCASISAATTRTFTFPDADQILAGRNVDNAFTASQTIGTDTGGAGGAKRLTLFYDNTDQSGGLRIVNAGSVGPVGAIFDVNNLTVESLMTFPDGGGTVLTDTSAIAVSNKILQDTGSNIIACSTGATSTLFGKASSQTAGFKFDLSSMGTSIRAWKALGDLGGGIPIVGVAAAAAAGALLRVNSTALTAIVGATNIVAAPIAGMYLVSYYYETTTATGGDGTVTFQVNYADDIGATNQVSAALSLAATGFIAGSFTLYAAAGTALSYQTNQATGVYTAATTRTALRVRTTFLG